jgi:hypothetical protein
MTRRNKKAFHAPLHPHDTEKQTFGCRHTNPIICSRHNMPEVCAFARENNICLAPPASWLKQYKKLKDGKTKQDDESLV